MHKEKLKKVAIVGGGAAGLMCAATLIEKGFSGGIVLFEHNVGLGAKVIISGGGRCNVTTGITDMQTLTSKYPRGALFLRSALKAFGPAKIYTWFESNGVPLKKEKDQRVFPVSDDGKDIVRVFEKIFARSNMHVAFRGNVQTIKKSGAHFCVTYKDSKEITHEELFDAVVLTTGGNAYAQTGSRGDGYAFARALGHTITPLGPSLNSFLTEESWTKELSGTSFPQACLRAQRGDGTKVEVKGSILLTHFGISGPVTFAFAAAVAHEQIDATHQIILRIQIDGARDCVVWKRLLTDEFVRSGAQTIARLLKKWMTLRFAQALCVQCGIDIEKKCAEISKKEKLAIATFLGDGFFVTLITRRAGDEFVTAGGVELSEVSSKTGESKIAPGLYFAGELLNVDGVTGGFNLTASWAMGYIVGRALAKNIGRMV